MRFLGALFAAALAGLGVTHIPGTLIPTPQFRGPTPSRMRRKRGARYADGVVQPQRMRDRERMQRAHKLHDEHGAFTLVGRDPSTGARRKWLAGISAQRGF